jgi:hypothetical protein
MGDEQPLSRFDRLEERVTEVEKREAGRDVKVEVATSAMNRLAVLVATAGVGLLTAVVGFILTGSHG